MRPVSSIRDMRTKFCPRLHRMAIDFCCIQLFSAFEFAFSGSGRVMDDYRSRLALEMPMVTRAWLIKQRQSAM
jgi:hypothetical protein